MVARSKNRDGAQLRYFAAMIEHYVVGQQSIEAISDSPTPRAWSMPAFAYLSL